MGIHACAVQGFRVGGLRMMAHVFFCAAYYARGIERERERECVCVHACEWEMKMNVWIDAGRRCAKVSLSAPAEGQSRSRHTRLAWPRCKQSD